MFLKVTAMISCKKSKNATYSKNHKFSRHFQTPFWDTLSNFGGVANKSKYAQREK